MRYFGSKSSTLPELGQIIQARLPKGTFCDAFGGIGTVGAHFKTLGYNVWTGDVLQFAHFFQLARIHRQSGPQFRRLRTELSLRNVNEVVDCLNGKSKRHKRDGWFVENYAKERKFFTIANARIIEHAWSTIFKWRKAEWVNAEEHAVLVASLIHAMDQVANTAGTYYAYLKTWHRKAKRPFRFTLLEPAAGAFPGTCRLSDAGALVAERAFDILYLDPPYNERSYAHYYHLPETVAHGRRPIIHGSSGIPINGLERSAFNDRKRAGDQLRNLLEQAKFNWLVFHYADNGLISKSEVRNILGAYGKLQEVVLQSRGYTTKKVAREVSHRLYVLENA